MSQSIKVYDCKLTEHFKLTEFCCHNSLGDLVLAFDERFLPFVNCLEEFRVWYNRPINITSGFRTASLNSKCGGSSNSSHRYALAVDFLYPKEFFKMPDDRKKLFLENVRLKWARLSVKYGHTAQTNYYDNRFHLGWSLNNKYSFLDFRSSK